MYEHTVIVGRLGRDPESRYTPQGQQVTTLNVAVDNSYTDASGQRQERTKWYRVSVWGKQADACNTYLAKGRMVLCEGECSASAYLAKDGTAKASLELRAHSVKFLQTRKDTGDVAGVASGDDVTDVPF